MLLSDYMKLTKTKDEVLAAAIGRSRASVSRYRHRLIRPNWEAVERICEFTRGAVTANDWPAPVLPSEHSEPDQQPAQA